MKMLIHRPLVRVLATFIFSVSALVALATGIAPTTAQAGAASGKPTVVLVHGAFADSSGWNNVSTRLLAKGYPVVAVANPLRGLKRDAVYLSKTLDSIQGPVVLVGHSYGGSVISTAAAGVSNVKALVYVAGYAPETGESAAILSQKFPGRALAPALAKPVVLEDGNKDLYIDQSKFPLLFAADVPTAQASLMAAAQRPVTEAAINEPAAVAAWEAIPSWFFYGSLDRIIPPAAHAFMAQRARAKKVVEINGASHVVMISHPAALVTMIDEAAAATRN